MFKESASGPGKVVGALFLLDCMGIILDHKVICPRRDRRERKNSPSSAICEAHAEVSAMYGKRPTKATTPSSQTKPPPATIAIGSTTTTIITTAQNQ